MMKKATLVGLGLLVAVLFVACMGKGMHSKGEMGCEGRGIHKGMHGACADNNGTCAMKSKDGNWTCPVSK